MSLKGKKIAAIAMVIILLAPLAAGSFRAGHTCEGEGCLVCAALRESMLGVSALVLAGVCVADKSEWVLGIALESDRILSFTPVRTRVRLND